MRLAAQRGAMMVDLLVTIAVTAIVMTAVFPLFLVLYRTEVDFSQQTQATGAGMVAEDTLLKDIRSFDVAGTGEDRLLLSGESAGGGTSYQVHYSIDSAAKTLVRTVTDQSGVELKHSVVAHSVQSFSSSCDGDPAVITVGLSVSGSQGRIVQLKPPLSFTPRNPQGCP
jgi:hypothetical protein